MKFTEDYAVFVLSLLIPITVGFYFACQGGRQKTTTEFLLADKNQRSWLIALSLVASYFSSVLLLGATAEVFTYGVQYIIFALFSYWIVAVIAHVIFIPMFHRVKITSVNEVSCVFLYCVSSKFFCLDLINNNTSFNASAGLLENFMTTVRELNPKFSLFGLNASIFSSLKRKQKH